MGTNVKYWIDLTYDTGNEDDALGPVFDILEEGLRGTSPKYTDDVGNTKKNREAVLAEIRKLMHPWFRMFDDSEIKLGYQIPDVIQIVPQECEVDVWNDVEIDPRLRGCEPAITKIRITHTFALSPDQKLLAAPAYYGQGERGDVLLRARLEYSNVEGGRYTVVVEGVLLVEMNALVRNIVFDKIEPTTSRGHIEPEDLDSK